jgi:thiamine-phosphate pyrophosphorylase
MPAPCLLYYITDRKAFPGDDLTRRRCLLGKIAEAARANIDYIQLREKDLPTRELELLAREAMQLIQKLRTENRELRTALLINSRTDVALATAARELSPRDPVIAISCHSPQEVFQAEKNQATFAVLAPIFEKKDAPGKPPQGLEALAQASHAKIPVLALGGITLQNAHSCLQAGAAGIAAIRLFQENDIATIVRRLRN